MFSDYSRNKLETSNQLESSNNVIPRKKLKFKWYTLK